jgi:antitoxin (DNA-binding transcriptional repressor) of toxin-antitoxin stability system
MMEVLVSEFKSKCLALLEEVRTTCEPLRSTRHGKPLAELIPPTPAMHRRSMFGSMKGSMTITGDIISPAKEKDDEEVLHDGSKLLLDTPIWFWFRADTQRLGRRTSQTRKDEQDEPPMSIWEALTLHKKERVQLHGDLIEWVARSTAGMKEAALIHDIMIVAR